VRFSIDANILVYATVDQTAAKHRAALEIMRPTVGLDCVVTLQARAHRQV
jgi:predicted nucleic acid-binding protein